MESLLKPVTENGDTSATRPSENGDCTAPSPTLALRGTVPNSPTLDSVLDEIRAGAENALYGAGSDKSEELFAKHVVSLIDGAGLPVLQTMHYRWFLRELARLWRTRTGRDLAFHLELCIRKWVGLGLEPKTLQFLVCEAHERLKGQMKSEVRDQNAEVRSPDGRSGTEPSATSASPAVVRGPEPNPTTKTPSHQDQNPGTPEPSDPGVLS